MDNHTQRIAAVREAVQGEIDAVNCDDSATDDSWYKQFALTRLAADLEHLAEHEAAEAANCAPCEVTAWHDCPQCAELRIYRARTEEIARLLGLAQGGENA